MPKASPTGDMWIVTLLLCHLRDAKGMERARNLPQSMHDGPFAPFEKIMFDSQAEQGRDL